MHLSQFLWCCACAGVNTVVEQGLSLTSKLVRKYVEVRSVRGNAMCMCVVVYDVPQDKK